MISWLDFRTEKQVPSCREMAHMPIHHEPYPEPSLLATIFRVVLSGTLGGMRSYLVLRFM